MIANLESALESYHQQNRNALCLFEILEQLQDRERGYDCEHYNYLTGISDPPDSANGEEVSWMVQKRPMTINAKAVSFADEAIAKQLLVLVRQHPSILGLLVLKEMSVPNETMVINAVAVSVFGRDTELLCLAIKKMLEMTVKENGSLTDLASRPSFLSRLLQFCIRRACFDVLPFFAEGLDHFVCLDETLSATTITGADDTTSLRVIENLRGESFLRESKTTPVDKRRSFRSMFFKKGESPLPGVNVAAEDEFMTKPPQWRKSVICQACDDTLQVLKDLDVAWPPIVYQLFKELFEADPSQSQLALRTCVRALLFDSFLFPALVHPERSGALTGRRLLPREQNHLLVFGEVLSSIFVNACGVLKPVQLSAPPNVREAMDNYVQSKQKEAALILDKMVERSRQFSPRHKPKSEFCFSLEMPWTELKVLESELRRGLKDIERAVNNLPGNLIRALQTLPVPSYPDEFVEIKFGSAEKSTSKLDWSGRSSRAVTVVKEPRRKHLKPNSRKYTVFRLIPGPVPMLQDLESFLKRFFVDRTAVPTSPANTNSRVRFNFASSSSSSPTLDLYPLVRLFCDPLWQDTHFPFDDIRSILLQPSPPLAPHSSEKTFQHVMTLSALLQNLRAQDVVNADELMLRGALQECLKELNERLDEAWQVRRQEVQEAIQDLKSELDRAASTASRLRDVFLHRRVLKSCGELEVPLKLMLPAAFSGAAQDLMLEFTNIASFVRIFRTYQHHFAQQRNRTFASGVFQAFMEAAQTQLAKREELSSDAPLLLERYVSLELFSAMFFAGTSPEFPSERDEKLMSKIRELSWLNPAALGLPKAVCEKSSPGTLVPPWLCEPIAQLRRLEHLWSPTEKLLCLSRVAKSIVLHLQIVCNVSTIDADTFLGALILVIVQGAPVRILANLDYIRTFGPQAMSGEATYCCTQFDIAIAFIKKTSVTPARVPIATSTVVFSYPNFLFGLLSCLETKECLGLMLVCSRIHSMIQRDPRLLCVCFPMEIPPVRPITVQGSLLSSGKTIQLPPPRAVGIRVKLLSLPRSPHANVRYCVALYATEQHCPFSFQYASQSAACALDPARVVNLHLVHYQTSPDPLIKMVVLGMDSFSEFVVGQVTFKMTRLLGRGFVEQALIGPEDILDMGKSVGTLSVEVNAPDVHPSVSDAMPEPIQANVSVWFKHVEDFLTVTKDVAKLQVHGSAHSVVGPVGEKSVTEVTSVSKPVPRRLRFERPMYFDQENMVRKPPPVLEVSLLSKQLSTKEAKTSTDKPVDVIASTSLNGPRDLCAHWGIWQAYDMGVGKGETFKKHLLLKPHFTGTIRLTVSLHNLSSPGAVVVARQAGLFVCQTEPVMSSSPQFATPLLIRLDRQPSLGPLSQHTSKANGASTGASTRLRPPFVDLYVFSPTSTTIDLQADWIGFVQISLPDALARILSVGSLEMSYPLITLDSSGNSVVSHATMQCAVSCSVSS